MALTDYAPSYSEQNQWAVRRRNSAQSLARNVAQTQFTRGNINANRAAETQSLTDQYNKMRERIPQTFAARGLTNSGIAAQGYQDYGKQRDTAFGDLARRYQQQLGQQSLNEANYYQDYGNQSADVASEEAARRADLAAQLRSLM